MIWSALGGVGEGDLRKVHIIRTCLGIGCEDEPTVLSCTSIYTTCKLCKLLLEIDVGFIHTETGGGFQ